MSYKHKERPNRIVEINWTQRKLSRIIDKTATDLHHIMWRCNASRYNVNIEQNKIRLSRREHVDYNNFVKDKQNPREAMQKMYELCKQVLRPEIREMLVKLLYNTDDEDFYIPELLKWKKKKKDITSTATTPTNVDID